MTLSSRHRTRNSSPGGLRPSTLPLGHGGSPQYWLSHVDGEETFFVSFKPPRPGTEPRTLAWKAAVLTTTLGPPPGWPATCKYNTQTLTHRPTLHVSVVYPDLGYKWTPQLHSLSFSTVYYIITTKQYYITIVVSWKAHEARTPILLTHNHQHPTWNLNPTKAVDRRSDPRLQFGTNFVVKHLQYLLSKNTFLPLE